jgi:hypothetical protein
VSDPVDVTRGDQSYCDWCLGELSPGSVRASEAVGLQVEFAWACGACLSAKAYLRPPAEWDRAPTEWPWHPHA